MAKSYNLSCSGCGEKISFALSNLDRHAHSTFTNLSADDADSVERAVAGHHLWTFIVLAARCQSAFTVRVGRADDLPMDIQSGLLSKARPANHRIDYAPANAGARTSLGSSAHPSRYERLSAIDITGPLDRVAQKHPAKVL